VHDVVAELTRRAESLARAGVPREGILIDPTHDFGKNTWHSLALTRDIGHLVGTGWPVLASLSNKDFVGESLGAGVADRLVGTLAATAVCAWQGVAVFRAHNVAETRQTLDMISVIKGTKPPARAVRGLV
jgi:dihydropteroate synthase